MNTIRKASFTCKEGGSNKEYHFQLVEAEGGYVINFQYGAIGKALKPDTKTKNGPVTLEKANKMFDAMIQERLSKVPRYVGGEDGAKESSFASGAAQAPKEIVMSPQLLNEIQDPEKYINDPSYAMQEKMDGERRMALINAAKKIGINKKGQEVPLQELIIASLSKFDEITLDAEIIGDKLYVFDLLSLNGRDYKNITFRERTQMLNAIDLGEYAKVVKTAFTVEEKRKLFAELKEKNAEGVTFKKVDSLYVSGRPSKLGDQLKFKWKKTASFIVSKLTEGKRSVELVLIKGGERVYVGKTTIPPNKDVPAVGQVVEVKYLYAYEGGCIFQSSYLNPRKDVDADECLITQLVYKAPSPDDEETE